MIKIIGLSGRSQSAQKVEHTMIPNMVNYLDLIGF